MLANRFCAIFLMLSLSPYLVADPDDGTSRSQSPRVAPRVYNWESIRDSQQPLIEQLDLPGGTWVGHLGFAKSDYYSESQVEKRLAVEIAERPAEAAHIAILSAKGLSPVLVNVATHQRFRPKNKTAHGQLVLIVDDAEMRANEIIRRYANLADVLIVKEGRVTLESVFGDVLSRNMAEGGTAEVLMKEGGEQAFTAFAQTILNARFMNTRDRLRLILDTNYFSHNLQAEYGEMAATQFLAAWNTLSPYLNGIEFEVGYHDVPSFEWREVENDVIFRTISPVGPEARELVTRLKEGRLHAHAFVRRWDRDTVRTTAAFDGRSLNVRLQIEARATEEAEKKDCIIEVGVPSAKFSASLKISDMERIEVNDFGDVYEGTVDLSDSDVAGDPQIEVALVVNNVPRAPGEMNSMRAYGGFAHTVSEQFEIVDRSSVQQTAVERAPHHWKMALIHAMQMEFVRIEKGHSTILAKPLASPKVPLAHFDDPTHAKKWLFELMAQLDNELNKPEGLEGRCATGFNPPF